MSGFKYVEDPILGKGRAEFDNEGGGGGSGGTSYIAGGGLNLAGGTFSLATADVQDVLNGTQTVEAVDVSALRGALTAGQAVDVTSKPDDFDEHVAAGTYKATFLWNRDYTLGFASFPKYANGLKYLLIADVQATEDGATVAGGGTWLSGGNSAIPLPNGTYTRIAMLFDSASACVLTFSGTDPFVKNLREYEVTACSNEAIAYIAALNNPDTFQDYYLVKRDMVSPWTYIIDMGESPATTVAAGLAYQIKAMTGSHIITVDTCPDGYVGRETFVRIFVGQTGNVVVQHPLQLATPLVANAINNCHISYRDGSAVLTVDDTVGGYVVDAASGTTAGTLYYGLTDSATEFISIPGAFDGIPVAIGGASVTTSGTAQKYVVGNGIANTLISGNLNAGTGKLNLSNIALSDVGITGGTMKIPNGVVVSGTVTVSSGASVIFNGGAVASGATVAMSGGGLAIEKVSGNGGVIDLGWSSVTVSSGVTASASGCTFSGGSASYLGGAFCVSSGGYLLASGCTFDGNQAQQGVIGGLVASADLYGCTFNGNNGGGGTIVCSGGSLRVESCVFSGNNNRNAVTLRMSATATLKGNTFASTEGVFLNHAGTTLAIEGSNAFVNIISGSGSVIVSSGATLNLTSNTNATPIAPGGGVIVDGGCTVINSAGASVSIAGGTYTKINKDGTTN